MNRNLHSNYLGGGRTLKLGFDGQKYSIIMVTKNSSRVIGSFSNIKSALTRYNEAFIDFFEEDENPDYEEVL